MKIKDLERTVNVAWSPATQHPVLLAAGTAAQQLDASFSTAATLEVYALNLTEPGLEMEQEVCIESEQRFYKIVWGSYNNSPGSTPAGIIIGGCDGGLLHIYNATELLNGGKGLVSRQEKHSGPVQALDFNPFQANLLASGAADSEIFIWDLNNVNTPMTPGAKSQPLEPVQSLSWNRQVQHILATTFNTRCVVWDLRKNEPIIKLSDTSSHIRWKEVRWHPEVATQLCLASEEDQAPVIQLWDLRFATSPLKVFEKHQRGVLSIDWCKTDPDLLISAGKDNTILCWNPNSNLPHGEVLSEVAHTLQWNFDVSFCPRNPALIAAASFDGHLSVYSLLGGRSHSIRGQHTGDKIADSFPGMEGLMDTSNMVQQQQQQETGVVYMGLTKAPKWMKKPSGARFAFGGKLITFDSESGQQPPAVPDSPVPALSHRPVYISQVITEPELITKSSILETALKTGDYATFCRSKADSSGLQHEKNIWWFLKAHFESDKKAELLNLLGFELNSSSKLKAGQRLGMQNDQENLDELTEKMNEINRAEGFETNSVFDTIASDALKNENLSQNKMAVPFKIRTGNDTDGQIAQAILLGNIEAAVDICLESDRMADALIIAMTGGSDLLARTQYRYLQQSEGYVSALISALVSEDWTRIIDQCTVDSWKEALAAALTYCSPEELPVLCERLGDRLEAEHSGNLQLLQDAQLCYICAGNFNKLVANWSADPNLGGQHSPQMLQELVERVSLLQKAIEQYGRAIDISGNLADLLSQYAILLASQGNLNSALNYLGSSTDSKLIELQDRLYGALGLAKTPSYYPTTNSLTQPQVAQPAQPTQYQRQISTGSTGRSSFSGYNQPPPGPPGPPMINQQFTTENDYDRQRYQKFNTGLPNNATPGLTSGFNNQAWGQPPKTFSPVPGPPPQHPPRPTSVGSNHGSSGISGKTKYVVDPSVQSSLPYRSSYGSPMLPTNPLALSSSLATPLNVPPSNNPLGNFAQPTRIGSGAPGSFPPSSTSGPYPASSGSFPLSSTSYAPVSGSSGPFPSAPVSNKPLYPLPGQGHPSQPGTFPSGAQQPVDSRLNTQPPPAPGQTAPFGVATSPAPQILPGQCPAGLHPGQNHPMIPATGGFGSQNLPNQPVSVFSPMNQGVEMAQQALEQPLNSMQVLENTPPGWNDPPALTKSNRPQAKPDFAPQAPITHPLYGSGSVPEMQPPINNGYGDHSMQGQVLMNQPVQMLNPGMNQPHLLNPAQGNQPLFNPGQGNPAQMLNNPGQGSQGNQGQVNALLEPPKQKNPIPEEHIHLRTVFDELRTRCAGSANNPQTKRKLEDVGRKLETLYDMLREHKLSAPTLSGLHQLVQLIQSGDYPSGLGLHTQLVSGPDFSQIASFMPGIKVLLQCALQLQVYLR